MRPHISIRGLVHPSVGPLNRWLVGRSVTLLSKSMKNGILGNLNDVDSAGRKRKERRGGRSDEESEK